MIEKLYIDNYRTLVNCEIPLKPLSLVLGENGSGKSSVLDVLRALKGVILNGLPVADAFPATTLTRWQKLREQGFALDLRGPAGPYHYELRLEHDPERRRARILKEEVSVDGHTLLSFEGGEVHLTNDRSSGGTKFTYDWGRSALSAIVSRPDNQKLVYLKDALGKVLVVKPCPPMVVRTSEQEQDELLPFGQNFVSWYRFIQRQEIGKQAELFRILGEVIPGFRSVSIAGEAFAPAVLRVRFRPDGAGQDVELDYDELSDGQRMLMLLYALLVAMPGDGWTLVVDEPDNYLALREIQPWLLALEDRIGAGLEQALIVSHHPECIDLHAERCGVWFSRPDNVGTRVTLTVPKNVGGLKISELVARGWEHE